MTSLVFLNTIKSVHMLGRDCPVFSMKLRGQGARRDCFVDGTLADAIRSYEVTRYLEPPTGWEAEWRPMPMSSLIGVFDNGRRYLDVPLAEAKRRVIERGVGIWPPELFGMAQERSQAADAGFRLPHPLCSDCGGACFQGRVQGEGYNANYIYRGSNYDIALELWDCSDEKQPYIGPWDFAGGGVFEGLYGNITCYKPDGLSHPHIDGRACLDEFIRSTVRERCRIGDVKGGLHILLMGLRQISVAAGFGDFYHETDMVICTACGRYRSGLDYTMKHCDYFGGDVCEDCWRPGEPEPGRPIEECDCPDCIKSRLYWDRRDEEIANG